jgi:hypothetical protein
MVEKWTKEVITVMELEKANVVKREKLKQMKEHEVKVHDEKHKQYQEHLRQVFRKSYTFLICLCDFSYELNMEHQNLQRKLLVFLLAKMRKLVSSRFPLKYIKYSIVVNKCYNTQRSLPTLTFLLF